MADFDYEKELTEKVGGIPVWGYGVALALVIGIVLYVRAHNAKTTPATAATATASPPPEEEGSEGISLGTLDAFLATHPRGPFEGGIFPGVPAPQTNTEWAHLMIDHFIGAGEDPTLVTDAFYRYLRKEKLTTAEAAIIDLALEIAVPPQGYLPVLRVVNPGKKNGKGKKKVRVPSVEGLQFGAASRKLEKAHLEIHAATPEKGVVAYQTPVPGMRVDEESTVTVHMAATG